MGKRHLAALATALLGSRSEWVAVWMLVVWVFQEYLRTLCQLQMIGHVNQCLDFGLPMQ